MHEPPSQLTPLRARARDAVGAAWERAVASGTLPAAPEHAELPAVEIERPAKPEHGDLATGLAMKLARPYRMPPLRIAQALADELATAVGEPGSVIAGVAVAPPGFLNLRLSDGALEGLVAGVLAAPEAWGRVRATTPRRVNVEFVSANPTGPLHIGNARGAFVGDLLCRVLEAAGHQVTREYYFNDFGAQVRNLGGSVVAIRRGDRDPRGRLPGRLRPRPGAGDPRRRLGGRRRGRRRRGGRRGRARHGMDRRRVGLGAGPGRDRGVALPRSASGSTSGRARARCTARAGSSGRSSASAPRATSTSRTARSGSARPTSATTRTGSSASRTATPPTSRSDIGYVVEKFSRGFDHLIYIWGADHHGTVARLRNAAEAMGYDREAVEMLLMAWVRFVRDGVEVSMSKRAGEFITLDELLAEIGVDAARWFFAARGHTCGIDFDIELAKKQSNENPVYYVQYAHARIASILRKAAEAGLVPGAGVAAGSLGGGPATPEGALVRALARFPEVVEDAAAAEETQGVTAFATELATQFHAFYRDARVVDAAEPERSASRLALVRATQQTLAGALGLLGISAPEAM